ncbi:hypothetical protein FTUN_2148 [Frigoriglobus tundricola]|uniref:Uncharacterized protein n=1 Tax=Frigoriglobus tundricola TaxID=2774151 RepID=A0A6M5YMQ5_9BACT|nr:hypothetical protein FTUN_2148 [Frigoriglobus tundricola]
MLRLGRSSPDATSGCLGGAARAAFGPDPSRPPSRSAGRGRELGTRRVRCEEQHYTAGRGRYLHDGVAHDHPGGTLDRANQGGVGEQPPQVLRNLNATSHRCAFRFRQRPVQRDYDRLLVEEDGPPFAPVLCVPLLEIADQPGDPLADGPLGQIHWFPPGRSRGLETTKAGATEHPLAFDHAGLLASRAPRSDRVALKLAIRQHQIIQASPAPSRQ